MKGHRSFDEWVREYERRDGIRFELSDGEKIVFDPDFGFFTYWYCAEDKEITIPKMCGEMKFWYPKIEKLFNAAVEQGIAKGVLFCTKRNPAAFIRLAGGRIRKVEHSFDFDTGKGSTLWFIFVEPHTVRREASERWAEEAKQLR